MRLCFILEAEYEDDEMPRAVAECLSADGHAVDLLEPHTSITNLSDLEGQDGFQYDAYVLKTAPDGPGLSILEAAGATGVPTINPWRSIRLVRDKAVAVALARVNGLRMPPTFFVSAPRLLLQVGSQDYPIVIKPSRGNANRSVHRVDDPGQLRNLSLSEERHFIAQRYVDNEGFDVKVYNTGRELFAVQWPSPLHPELKVTPRLLPVTPELREIALRVGRVFGLRIYGIDLLSTPDGWVAVDVNDFPSFHQVPDAPERLAASVIHTVGTARRFSSNERASRVARPVGPAGGEDSDRAGLAPRSNRAPPARRHQKDTHEETLGSLPDH
jgi:ribosomal protein S6--L-glutamate ligase